MPNFLKDAQGRRAKFRHESSFSTVTHSQLQNDTQAKTHFSRIIAFRPVLKSRFTRGRTSYSTNVNLQLHNYEEAFSLFQTGYETGLKIGNVFFPALALSRLVASRVRAQSIGEVPINRKADAIRRHVDRVGGLGRKLFIIALPFILINWEL